ncbi:Tm-1-like ATP-binding domain-containing protein [Microbacterium sp. Root180]|uniref:Tm-1-like ATP-binding domain-containing protein n=1 Tax=Microbacterium sp. Root180 TaxID=1736483 RepID=UPI0006FDAEBA|nr:Tm-1-like ATP-binding domain-containing protein [Microbacterium sp. Root180]KRB36647.1 hypothetical protein ASD93_11380 [Microbacterium sp. Root180]
MILLAGSFDTKAAEFAHLRDVLVARGEQVLLVDVGTSGVPGLVADVTREAIARAGDVTLGDRDRADRAPVLAGMAEGLRRLALERADDLTGAVAVGGSGAVALAAPAFVALPLGMPKLLLTTMAEVAAQATSGSDVIVVPSPVDFAGLNGLTRLVLDRAAAMVSAAAAVPEPREGGRTVAVTMFGVTTTAATEAARVLASAGWEPVAFHANGAGGRTVERLVRDGRIAAVLDLTTTELADELLGGKATAGPDRLGAAARAGIPQVVSVGALDIANFGPPDTVPARLRSRTMSQHGPLDTLVRTNSEDGVRLGEILAEKLTAATGPTTVVLPEGGFSSLGAAGGAFADADADAALVQSLVTRLSENIRVVHAGVPLDTADFGRIAAQELLALLPPSEMDRHRHPHIA